MRVTSFAAIAGLMLAAAPAWTQDAMENAYRDAVVSCLTANKDQTNPPADDLAACQPALAAFETIDAGIASPTPHQINVRHFYRAYVHTAIGGAYASLDKVRSSRVCNSVEASWREISQIDPAVSPAGFVSNYQTMRQSGMGTTAKCRSEKGTPPDGAPLS